MEMPNKLDMYNASVLPLLRGLNNLSNILDKAISCRDAKKCSDAAIVNARLSFDMFPFSKQIQIACDTAKGAAGRLSGTELPKFEDNETTLDELKQRIQKTIEFVQSVDAKAFDGTETKEIVLTFGTITFPHVGYSYLTGFVLPNFYFHSSIAYAILRSNGVDLGKVDFLGS